jgi:hypothetical protein
MSDWKRWFNKIFEMGSYKINGSSRISIKFCKGKQSGTSAQRFLWEGDRRDDMERQKVRGLMEGGHVELKNGSRWMVCLRIEREKAIGP